MKTFSKIAGVAALIILLGFASPIGTNASEYAPPVFKHAEFLKDTYDIGEPIMIQVDSEPGTNPMDIVWVQIEHEQSGQLFYSHNIPYKEGGTDVAIDLPETAPSGKYVIQAVSLIDESGVTTNTFRPGGSFELVGGQTDIEKPIFKGASFDKEQYEPGDEVVLKVDTTDEQSGIENVYASIQHLESKDYRFWGFSTEVDGQQEIRFQIPYNALSGEYGIQYLTISDNAGNDLNVFNAAATFRVIGGSTDTAAPTLKNISIDKGQYKQGEQVHINIDAEDESGVEKVYLYVRHKQTGVQYNAFATFNGTTFDFNRYLPDNAPLGQYEVFAVYLEDSLGNQTNLFNYKPRIEFEVVE